LDEASAPVHDEAADVGLGELLARDLLPNDEVAALAVAVAAVAAAALDDVAAAALGPSSSPSPA
jgi:hypothetical protein